MEALDPCACGHDHTMGRNGTCGTFICDCTKWHPPSAVAVQPDQHSLFDVREDAIDALLFGSGGVFAIPAETNIKCERVKAGYRLTLTLKITHPDQRAAPEAIGARRILKAEGAQ